MLQFVAVVVIAVLVALDQGIKYLAVVHLEPIGSFPLLNGILQLSYVENTGAAFGSFSKYTTLLSVFTGLVLLGGFVYLLMGKCKPVPVYISAILILAGGAGNLIDRVFRGFVVDYIEPLFIEFAVFNFADILVCVGAAILIIYLLYDMFHDAKKTKQAAENKNATD
ncbi:MAG: signal peptidase II [Candidatus Fimenecus sp.]